MSYIKPLDHQLHLDQTPEGNQETFKWSNESTNHTFMFTGTVPKNLEEQKSFLARLACHLLIDQTPDEGLKEACDFLKENYEFYIEKIAYNKKNEDLLLTNQDSTEATFATLESEVQIRPSFIIEDF